MNPFLKTSKKNEVKPSSRKGSLSTAMNSLSINPKILNSTNNTTSLMDNNLVSPNINQKNPVIYNKKFITPKSKALTLSPDNITSINATPKGKKVSGFEQRLNDEINGSTKSAPTGKGILRWDNLSFSSKSIIMDEELKNIKKKLKDKKAFKEIATYRKIKFEEITSKNSRKKSINEKRLDVFGNEIIKGNNTHRVSFSSHGDLKIVENWKSLNLKMSIKPDKSNVDDEHQKKCSIF